MFVPGHQPLTVCDREVLDTIMKVLMIKVSLYCCENKINTITPQFYYDHFSARHEVLAPAHPVSLLTTGDASELAPGLSPVHHHFVTPDP